MEEDLLLTDEEIKEAWKSAKPNKTEFYSVAQAQLDKVLKKQLAKFVPVQLEVLGDEEIKGHMLYSDVAFGKELILWGAKISQATNAHNEAKGQLYRR